MIEGWGFREHELVYNCCSKNAKIMCKVNNTIQKSAKTSQDNVLQQIIMRAVIVMFIYLKTECFVSLVI